VSRFLFGYAVALAGVALLFLSGAWWSWASNGYEVPGGPPWAWRALVTVGWALFVIGLLVQATGYGLIHQFPQPRVGAHI